MIEQDPKIKKAMPPKHDAECLRVLQDIVIPRGTLLRTEGGGIFSASVDGGKFSIVMKPGETLEGYRRVVAA